MSNKHCSSHTLHKGRHLPPKPKDYYHYCYKKYHIKTSTAVFVSITKTKRADCDPEHLQQVQWSGSSQDYRASISQTEKTTKKLFIVRN